MAGIYLHIPFCASRCIYCAFFTSTQLSLRNHFVDALCREVALRHAYLTDKQTGEMPAIHTLYLGGGTPSQLSTAHLSQIFHTLQTYFTPVDNDWSRVEVTIECNPDDITPEWVSGLRSLPINRVSMGVQSFDDTQLRFLRRRHNGASVLKAVDLLHNADIHNISIDLIYGFPQQTLEKWKQELDIAVSLDVQHVSAYALSYEPHTPLHRWREQGRVTEVDEELSLSMFQTLIERMSSAGFEHYEVSNFALPGYRARHNSSYWQGVPYLGLGAGAHSFDGNSRQWNVEDIPIYIKGIEQNAPEYEQEHLTLEMQYNEMVMTRLRTREGIDLDRVLERFGTDYYQYLLTAAKPYLECGRLLLTNRQLHLSKDGIFVSDGIIEHLARIEE